MRENSKASSLGALSRHFHQAIYLPSFFLSILRPSRFLITKARNGSLKMAPQPAPFEPNVPPDELEGDKAQVESKDDAALLQTMGYKPVRCPLHIPS